MSDDLQRMVGFLYLLCDSVMWYFFRHFFGKGAEHAVPDDEGHPHILVEVRDIACMMHAVVRRGYKYIFYPAGQFFYVLGMHQYATYLSNGIHENGVKRLEADKH